MRKLLALVSAYVSSTVIAGPIDGYVDRIKEINPGGLKYQVEGWACDKGVSQSINVHLYAGGAASQGGQLLKIATANKVWSQEGTAGLGQRCSTKDTPHRFEIVLSPEEVRPIAGKSIFVYGISKSGGGNLALSQSGEFKFPTPPEPPKSRVIGRIDSWDALKTQENLYELRGWACAVGSNRPVSVEIYFGSPDSHPRVRRVEANLTSEAAVSSRCGTQQVGHRFSVRFTKEELKTHFGKPIHVFGISSIAVATNKSLLQQSGILTTKEITDYTIPSGATVYLEPGKTYHLQNHRLVVNGKLQCRSDSSPQTREIKLNVNHILVEGNGAAFECGTNENPYLGKLTMALGREGLHVQNSGVLKLISAKKKSWLPLQQDVFARQNKIVLSAAPAGWRIGDRLVISSSAFGGRSINNTLKDFVSEVANSVEPVGLGQVEEVTIQQINGNEITLENPLQYFHSGRIYQVDHNRSGIPEHIDMRAHVGNLSRDIKVTTFGINSVEDEKSHEYLGAHIMVMMGGKAYLDSVELYRMGQKNVLGRYPFHWHKNGNSSFQYIINSSIHRSFNRCVTIHASDNTVVNGNFCYRNFGHGFFLEDGNEENNRIIGNLGIRSLLVTNRGLDDNLNAPYKTCFEIDSQNKYKQLGLLTSDTECGDEQVARFKSPSTFWITNPNNKVVGNVAANSDGTGFWMAFSTKPLKRCDSYDKELGCRDIIPARIKTPEGYFSQNIAYGTTIGFTWDGAHDGGIVSNEKSIEVPRKRNLMQSTHYHPQFENDSDLVTISDLTAYGTNTGVYFRGERVKFERLRMADNERSLFLAFNQVIENSLLVGRTYSMSYPIKNGKLLRFSGVRLYDGPFHLKNVHVQGFRGASERNLTDLNDSRNYSTFLFETIAGSNKFVNSVEGISYSLSPLPYAVASVPPPGSLVHYDAAQYSGQNSNRVDYSHWQSAIWDKDGTSIFGNLAKKDKIITMSHVLRLSGQQGLDGSCKPFGNTGKYLECDKSTYSYGSIRFSNREIKTASVELKINDGQEVRVAQQLMPKNVMFDVLPHSDGNKLVYEITSNADLSPINGNYLNPLHLEFNSVHEGDISPELVLNVVPSNLNKCTVNSLKEHEMNSLEFLRTPQSEEMSEVQFESAQLSENSTKHVAYFHKVSNGVNQLRIKILAGKRSDLKSKLQFLGTGKHLSEGYRKVEIRCCDTSTNSCQTSSVTANINED